MDAFDLGFMVGMRKQAGLAQLLRRLFRRGGGRAKRLGAVTRSRKGMDWFEALYDRMRQIRSRSGKEIATAARQGYRMKPRKAGDIAKGYDQLAKYVEQKMQMPKSLQLRDLANVNPVSTRETYRRLMDRSNFAFDPKLQASLARSKKLPNLMDWFGPAKKYNPMPDPTKYTSAKMFGKSHGKGVGKPLSDEAVNRIMKKLDKRMSSDPLVTGQKPFRLPSAKDYKPLTPHQKFDRQYAMLPHEFEALKLGKGRKAP